MPAPRPTFDSKHDRQPDVFLSHSSRDKVLARKLACDLSSVGVDVWFDDWELDLGDSLYESIGRGLKQSRFVAVVLTNHFVSSAWCKKELEQAFSFEETLGRAKVLPLIASDIDLPPFLTGRIHQRIQGDGYYVGIARIAGIVHGYSRQSIADQTAKNPPTSMESVATILLNLGWNKRFFMNPDEFDRHKAQIYDYCKRHLSDMQYDAEYLDLIRQMQQEGIQIFPISWPFPSESDPHHQ